MKNQLKYRLICALLLLVASLVAVSFARGQVLPGPGFLIKPGFTPLSLSPSVWLDASDASTVTLVSSAVSQWNDKSGNARHYTQATAGNRPTYITGTSVNFDGTSHYLQTASHLGVFGDGSNVIVAVVFNSTTKNAKLLSDGGASTTNVFDIYTAFSDGNTYLDAANTTTSRLAGALTWTTTSVGIFRRQSGTMEVRKNGVSSLNSTGATGTYTATGIGLLGAGSTTDRRMSGAVMELIVFTDHTKIGQVEAYLKAKWGTP